MLSMTAGPRRVRTLTTLLMALAISSCTRHIVRDATVYQTELNQYDAWATRQAALLKSFMADSCTCDGGGKFTTKECAEAADFVLTIEARSAWHKAMSLFLAGITEERPAEVPPEIAPSSSLCPKGGA